MSDKWSLTTPPDQRRRETVSRQPSSTSRNIRRHCEGLPKDSESESREIERMEMGEVIELNAKGKVGIIEVLELLMVFHPDLLTKH